MKKQILPLILLWLPGAYAAGAETENYEGVPVTLNITTPGTLRQTLYQMDVEDISTLTISGSLDAADLKYIAEGSGAIPTAECIDVSGVTLVPGGNSYLNRQLSSGNSAQAFANFYISDECSIDVVSEPGWLGTLKFVYEYRGNNFAGVFAGLSNLKKVKLPDYITEIGPATFMGCSALTEFSIPDGVRLIGRDAFSSTGIESLSLPASLSTIDSYAFASSSIKEIKGGPTVHSIGYRAFYRSKIESIDLSELSVIEESAFSMSSLKGELNLRNIVEVPKEAFTRTRITSLILGPLAEKLGDSAFASCSSLASVEMPETLSDIGSNVFYNTPWYNNLSPVDGVIYINTIACKLASEAPSTVTVREGTLRIAPQFATSSSAAIRKIIFPESLKEIGTQAFERFTALTSVQFADNVEIIGDRAFNGCTNLGFNHLPANLKSIGYRAFYGCSNIFEVCLGTKLEEIGQEAFAKCPSITKIELHSPSASGLDVFSNIESYKIVIGKEVESVSDNFFGDSYGLTELYFEDRPDSKPLRIGDDVFGLYTNRCTMEVRNAPSCITDIGTYAFYYAHFEDGFDFSNTQTIGHNAFGYASGLQSRLVIPVNMKEMGSDVFTGVTDIEEVELHATNMQTSLSSPFGENSSIKRALICKEVQVTPRHFLYGSAGLKALEFEKRPASGELSLIVDGYLYGCLNGLTSLGKVEFPDGLVSLDASSLDTNIREFTLPASFKEFTGSRTMNPSLLTPSLPNLRVITCYASNPPEGFRRIRYNTLKTPNYTSSGYNPLDVYVPFGRKAAYMEDKDFATCNIIEMQTSGVEAPALGETADDDSVEGIYTLSGQKVSSAAAGGVYIVRYRSGRVEKIVAPARGI